MSGAALPRILVGLLHSWKVHLARMRQASRQASRLWKLPLMLWKVEQNRHLARMRQASRQASRQAGVEAGLEAIRCHGCNGKWSKTDT